MFNYFFENSGYEKKQITERLYVSIFLLFISLLIVWFSYFLYLEKRVKQEYTFYLNDVVKIPASDISGGFNYTIRLGNKDTVVPLVYLADVNLKEPVTFVVNGLGQLIGVVQTVAVTKQK